MFSTPILFIIFNRPETTKIVFDSIKNARPKQLFIAADGPRNGNQNDILRCQEARKIIDEINWDCEVKLLLRDENLGCGLSVSSAISWFFEQVEEGIILEDDCLPHPDFFQYCKELLDVYRNNEKVMFIGGSNFQDGLIRDNNSYYFSAYNHVWGWATWKRTWILYDFSLETIGFRRFNVICKSYFLNWRERKYWNEIFKMMKERRIDTWDHQLSFSIWNNDGLSIIPNVNLVSNIGFGFEATHTKDEKSIEANKVIKQILPITHIQNVKRNYLADKYFFNTYILNSSFKYFSLLKNMYIKYRNFFQ
jgi:hypothetical protein